MKLAHSYSSLKLFENCPLRYYRQRIIKDIKDEGGEASIHGDRIHKLLEARLRGSDLDPEISRYGPLCDAVEKLALEGELLIEHEMVLTENLTPTTWWAKDAWLRSKLDILVLKGPDAVVMDWKTGKRYPDFFQMLMFAAQVFKYYPEVQRVRSSLVWLKDLSMDTEDYDRADMARLWSQIMSKIHRIEEAVEVDNWPARPSGLCRYCPARHDCKYAIK